jgi:head-tail adaptor
MPGTPFPLYERLGSLLTIDAPITGKAGFFAKPIKATHGTVGTQVAAQHGVEVVANGFRCPPNRANGGTFTDAMGTTCGVMLAVDAVADAISTVAEVAKGSFATQGREGGKAGAVRAKNKQILDAIEQAGGHLFAPSDDYAAALERKNANFEVLTPEQRHAEQVGRVKYALKDIREYLSTGKRRQPSVYDGSVVTEWKEVDNLHPDVKKLLAEASDEELVQIMHDTAMRFHEGVSRNLRVSMPHGTRFDLFLEEGRYKTTHEATSDHSTPDIRRLYEAQIGMPRDLAPQLRPASGYVTHPDWDEAAAEKFSALNEGKEPNEFSSLPRGAYGAVDSYGQVDLVLRPEVAERAAYGHGDSISTMLLPTRLDETDPEKVFSALLSSNGRELHTIDRQILGMLEANRTGSFKYLNSLHGASNPDGEENLYRQYFEALIPGSFGVEDVAAVRMPFHYLSVRTVSAQDRLSGKDALEQTKKIRDEFFSTEMLQRMGFSEEEIQYVMGMLDNFKNFSAEKPNIPYMTKQLQQLLDFRVAKERKAKIEAKGIQLQVSHHMNADPFNPASYGGKEGDDIEQILHRKVLESIPKAVREERERTERMAREKAEREARGEPEPSYG